MKEKMKMHRKILWRIIFVHQTFLEGILLTRGAPAEMDPAGASDIHHAQLEEKPVFSPDPAGGDAIDQRVYRREDNVSHEIEPEGWRTRRPENHKLWMFTVTLLSPL